MTNVCRYCWTVTHISEYNINYHYESTIRDDEYAYYKHGALHVAARVVLVSESYGMFEATGIPICLHLSSDVEKKRRRLVDG